MPAYGHAHHEQAPRPALPTHRRQKQRADQAFVGIDGKRHELGVYGSGQSRAGYQHLVGHWLGAGGELPFAPEALTVVELLARWWGWPEPHDRHREVLVASSVQGAARRGA